MTRHFRTVTGAAFCCFIFAMTACRPPSLELEYEEITIVDTLYKRAITDYRKELDSICDHNYDSLVQVKVDSLVERQLSDLIKLTTRE